MPGCAARVLGLLIASDRSRRLAGCPGISRTFFLIAVLALPGVAHATTPPVGRLHDDWDALLKKHVVVISGGKASQMDYAGIARDRVRLKAYLEALAGVGEAKFGAWAKAEQMAFLINAYNAFMVEKVLTRYPNIGSVWDFGKLFGNPFKDRFFTLLGRPSSLDRIEHELLRQPGVYDEPRVHFAVNCASVSCPMLREEAYAAERLDAQLEDQARRFLADRSRNRYDAAKGALEVSKIFDWYKIDWSSGYRGIRGNARPIDSLPEYFGRYSGLLADDSAQQRRIAERKAGVRYLEYDWAINDVKR